MNKLLISIILLILTSFSLQGPLAAGICYSGCNVVWVACVAAAGGIAGVTTGGLAVPAAILACNSAQGICMASCVVALLSPTL